jgi:hypothetical protein
MPRPPQELPTIYQTAVSFDEGKYAHVVLLDGNIHGQLTGSHEMDEFNEEQQCKFEKHLLDCAEVLKARRDFNGGMTLMTRGGLGRGFALSLKRIPEWGMIFSSLPDWHTIARCTDMSALRLWRMWRHQRWAEKRGVKILNLCGPLNLYACWRSNDWRFVPREMPLSQPHKLLSVGTDFIAEIRREVLSAYDDHSIPAHDETHWVRVERRGAKAIYESDKVAPVYLSEDGIAEQMLIGCVETPKRIWWVACKTKATTREERAVLFQLWDCLLNWMHRAVSSLEIAFPSLPTRSIWIELDVLELSKWADHAFPQGGGIIVLPTPAVDRASRKIMVTLPAGFCQNFHAPKNQAEQMLMGRTITATSELAGAALSIEELTRILSAVFPNDEARFFHVVQTQNWAQMLAPTDRPEPRFVPEEECSCSLIGLADEIGSVPTDGKISGDRDCLAYLQKVVDKLWERIEKALGQFDRRSVATACFSALAELEKDSQHFSMTARALLALHDRNEVLQFVGDRRSDRDAATLTNRLLIETAMYACPANGGHTLPNAERLELLAHMSNLLNAANHRDAISEGFMRAEIHVFPNGELDFDKKFYETVMLPYVRAISDRRFHSSARNYERWFPSHGRPENPEQQEALNRMEQPFLAEFGVTIDQLIAIPNRLGHLALRERKLILELDNSSFRTFLMNECSLDEKATELYLKRFSLASRGGWDMELGNCQVKDVWPWRFRRQLSLLMRPLVLLSDSTGERWLVYPPLVASSAAYIIGNIGEAAFPTEHFRTEPMRAFCGDQANRQGHKFNDEVRDEVEKLGFIARQEVSMSALGVPASAGDFGDVDVLAWKSGSSNVFVIECKRLRTAVSVRDVVERLDDYRGERDDSLAKHLRRLNWLKVNPTALCELTKIPATAIQFKSLLVTDDLVPMQFFKGSAISPEEILDFRQLAEFLMHQRI